MRFVVGRSSLAGENEKPCDEAVYEDGKWVVELDSLDDLQVFCKRYGSVMLEPIEIGDWYLEIYDLFITGV